MVLENEERANEIRVIKREAVKAEKEKESLEFQLQTLTNKGELRILSLIQCMK